jgi:hypothetical protein
MSELTGPDTMCTVDGCHEPAVVTPRAPTTDEVSDASTGELVPLCAEHAEQADVPPVPGQT